MYSVSFICALRRVWHYFRYMDTAFTKNLSSRSLTKLRNDSGTSKELPSPPSPLAAPSFAISSRNLARTRLLYLAHRWWRETTGCNTKSWLESIWIFEISSQVQSQLLSLLSPFLASLLAQAGPHPAISVPCSEVLCRSRYFNVIPYVFHLVQNIPQGPFFFHPQGKGF